MHSHGGAFNMVSEKHLCSRTINEPVLNDVFDRARLGEKGQQSLFAVLDHGSKLVELCEKFGAAVHNALVVKRDERFGVNVPALLNCSFKVFEIRPVVAVIRPKAGEVNIGNKENAVWFDQKSAMAPGMAG